MRLLSNSNDDANADDKTNNYGSHNFDNYENNDDKKICNDNSEITV